MPAVASTSPPVPPLKRAPRWGRRFLLGVFCVMGLCLALAASASCWVEAAGSAGIYRRLADVPERPVAIVFGARVYESGAVSPVLDQRVRAAVDLYQAGKVRKLLMTGDNGRVEYDEVTAMKRRAMELGVPARDVVRDFAGFRTYDSCYRAQRIFGVESAVLVTQEFHLDRALFLARRFGIDAVGYVAEPGMPDAMIQSQEAREVPARIAAAFDSLSKRSPRFLGAREPLFQDERDDR
ncbi:MAG: SanA/YdcF family protein [Actinomycetota bacterium]